MDARPLKPEMTGSSPAGATVAIGQWQSGRLWFCLWGRKMSGGHLLCADRSGAETDSPWSPHGWVCLVARAADCKSVTKKHRRFESCPIHFPFACPRGLWCHPAKVVCGNAPKVQILPQTLQSRDEMPGFVSLYPPAPCLCGIL